MRVKTVVLWPVSLLSRGTNQSSDGESGVVPRATLPPPITVDTAASNTPVRGLYQRFWKTPDTPLRSSVPVVVAVGRYTAYNSPGFANTCPLPKSVGSPVSSQSCGSISQNGNLLCMKSRA